MFCRVPLLQWLKLPIHSLWTQSTHTCLTQGGQDISAFPKRKCRSYSCVHKYNLNGFIYYKTLAELSGNVWRKVAVTLPKPVENCYHEIQFAPWINMSAEFNLRDHVYKHISGKKPIGSLPC